MAEAAVFGKPDAPKGNLIKAFVILKLGEKPSDKHKLDLKYHVRMTLGPIAQPEDIEFVDKLPKTRSGKIMRRVLKAKELGMDPGETSPLLRSRPRAPGGRGCPGGRGPLWIRVPV